jgi:RNA polymerase sigma-70 factor (ECF subfamily)
MISFDEEAAEGRYQYESGTSLTPEKLFDRRWALTVLEEAMGRLQAECRRAGMQDLFSRTLRRSSRLLPPNVRSQIWWPAESSRTSQ